MIELGPKELALLAISGFGAMQKPDELEALVQIVDSLQPKIVLEIGVGKGGTAWCWSKIKSVQTLIAIDLPGGPWGAGPDKASIEYIAANTKAHLHFIAGNSANSASLDAVKNTLGEDKVDFLMIDGDHSKYGVACDFETYSPLVREGGLVGFHDILPHAPETKCEVDLFWNELKTKYPQERYAEFCSEPLTWGGVGVIKW